VPATPVRCHRPDPVARYWPSSERARAQPPTPPAESENSSWMQKRKEKIAELQSQEREEKMMAKVLPRKVAKSGAALTVVGGHVRAAPCAKVPEGDLALGCKRTQKRRADRRKKQSVKMHERGR